MKAKVSDLKANPRNPRIIRDEQFKKLVQSIRDFPRMLELRPLVVDADGFVLGGNMRLRAIQELGIEEVPIVRAEDLTEAQKKEFVIKDNVSYGEWEWEALANEYDASKLQEWGLDVPNATKDQDDEAEEDDFNIPDRIETSIKAGDLITIGEHVLLCGDARQPGAWEKLMNGEKADLVVTDPPYGVSYAGAAVPAAKEWEMIKNDDLRGDELNNFLLQAFIQISNNTKQDAAFYVWYASKTHIEFETALSMAGLIVRQQLIWNKGMSLGHADYHWAHEPILYAKKAGGSPTWYGDRTHKTVLGMRRTDLTSLKKEDMIQIIKNLLDTSTNWEINRDSVVTYKHPTQKPVTLMGRAMTNSSQEGEIVVDPFIGSGTTMAAAEQLKRRCRAMELDPKFCQVTVDRMRRLSPDLIVKRNGKLL